MDEDRHDILDDDHPEARCDRCERRNPVWWTPAELWKAVEIDHGFNGVLCPTCFIKDAEARGITAPQGTPGWLVSRSAVVPGDTETTVCEHGEVPCERTLRDPWCGPCMLNLIGQQNDLNERLNTEIERLREQGTEAIRAVVESRAEINEKAHRYREMLNSVAYAESKTKCGICFRTVEACDELGRLCGGRHIRAALNKEKKKAKHG